ncbi:MAG: redoxin domain-containing protein [Thermoplasmata archaeon]|nr:redoxin domain-containing protein [Thermoplasmata archaeon]
MKVGDMAEDFILKDNRNREFNLSDYRGKKVLLSFHPLAWTPVCAEQMKSLEKNKEKFDELNTVAVGISVDSVPCKNAWAKELKIAETQLLSDFWPHGGVAKAYGMLREEGFSERANIILDEEGKVIFIKVYDIPQLPDINEIIDFLEQRN